LVKRSLMRRESVAKYGSAPLGLCCCLDKVLTANFGQTEELRGVVRQAIEAYVQGLTDDSLELFRRHALLKG
jgi:hypothetical protein